MRQLKELLRLKYAAALTHRQIARSLNLSTGVVSKYVQLAEAAHITYPLPDDIDDARLQQLLSAAPLPPAESQCAMPLVLPDFPDIHTELKRKGVTRLLLWQEYATTFPGEAYGYSQFCELYRRWRAQHRSVMRQVHRAGEKLFVDYCGPTVEVINAATGEVKTAQIFVAVMGASNYTFAEATWTQALPDWIGSHVRAFTFFGAVPHLVIPDNLKSGVTRACRYDPALNTTYAEMLAYYQTAALPARPYKPRDKAKVEVGVQVVERWIIARLRHVTFFTLGDLNRAIRLLLGDLNTRPFKKLPGSRRSQFETLDLPAMRPLPLAPYEFAEWKKARVGFDYHIEVERHFYSVPHPLVRREVEVRLTATTVEVFHASRRVASHVRSPKQGNHTTLAEHMPKAHREHMEWTPGRFLNWAQEIGPSTRDMVSFLLTNRPHPEMGYRSCLGLLSLAKRYGNARLESACERALLIGSPTRQSVVSILKQGLDCQPLPETDQAETSLSHENVRGAAYYQ
jgi:transposase